MVKYLQIISKLEIISKIKKILVTGKKPRHPRTCSLVTTPTCHQCCAVLAPSLWEVSRFRTLLTRVGPS